MVNFLELKQQQAEARARRLQNVQKKSALLTKLESVGREIANEEAQIEKAKRDEKRAREEEARQERLRASQREYLEQAARRNKGLNLTELEQYDWYAGLMEHQLEAIEFGTAARRWVLGDEPGLGKTRASIGWLDTIGAKKVIVVAPPEVAGQFANEIREIASHRTVIELHSLDPKIRAMRQERMLNTEEAVVVINYEIFRSSSTDIMNDLLQWRADTVIADEAHVMRNAKTANYRYVERLISHDLYCGKCRGEVPGLVARERNERGKPIGPPRVVPCPHCGWKKGTPSGYNFRNQLDKITHTRSVKNVAMLTGTPLLNSPEELFAVFHLVRPDLFPNLASFKSTFTYANAAGHRFFTQKGLENLSVLIQPVYLARKKGDAGIVLPDRSMHDVMVPIEESDYPKQRKVISQITHYSQILLEDGRKLAIMEQLAQITRLRQANVFPGGIEVWDIDEEGERVLVFSTAEEIEEAAKMDEIELRIAAHEGQRQVVFSQFSSALKKLEQRLKDAGIRVARLDGSTPRSLRDQIKTNFYRALAEEPKWDIVLVNYKTGGAGLNLTACTVTHLLDSEWNPGNEDQSLGRTYRIGQEEETVVYRYLVPRSIDTRIEAIKRRKKKLVEAFEVGEIRTLKFDKEAEIAEALGTTS